MPTKIALALLILTAALTASAECVFIQKDGAIKLLNSKYRFEEFESCAGTMADLHVAPLQCEAGILMATDSKTGIVLAYQVHGDERILTCTPKK